MVIPQPDSAASLGLPRPPLTQNALQRASADAECSADPQNAHAALAEAVDTFLHGWCNAGRPSLTPLAFARARPVLTRSRIMRIRPVKAALPNEACC